MVWLRLLHIVGGIVWVGGALYAALFLVPTARAAGADGGRLLERVMRRSGPALGVAMLITIVSGFLMYSRLSVGFNPGWVRSRMGLTLAAGAGAALLAAVVGVAVNAPAGGKIVALRRRLEAEGRTPAGADAARLATLTRRVERGGQLIAGLLLLATAAMATARYL